MWKFVAVQRRNQPAHNSIFRFAGYWLLGWRLGLGAVFGVFVFGIGQAFAQSGAIQIDTSLNGQSSNQPLVINGTTTVNVKYTVTNSGTTYLDTIKVFDDNGTSDPSDDVLICEPSTLLAPQAQLVCGKLWSFSASTIHNVSVKAQVVDENGVPIPDEPDVSAEQSYEIILQLISTIQGQVWHDANHNGNKETSEMGIGGSWVTLRNSNNQCTSQLTDVNGFFEFAVNQNSGTYTLISRGDLGEADANCSTLPVAGYSDNFTGATTVLFATVNSSTANPPNTYFGYDQPAIFSCDVEAYLTQDSPAKLRKVNLATGNVVTLTTSINGNAINGIGYNSGDSLIYGYDTTANRVIRISADNPITAISFPAIANLPAQAYNTGDIYDGYLYLYRSSSTRYYVVDINPQRPTFRNLVEPNNLSQIDVSPYGNLINNGTAVNIVDWVFDTSGTHLYAGLTTGNIISVNPVSGSISTVASGALPTNEGAFGAAYATSGFLYFSANTSGKIYRHDLSNGVTIEYANGISSSNNDGASCTYASIQLDFDDLPDSQTGSALDDFHTRLVEDGPRHFLPFNSVALLTLGEKASSENDGKPSAQADLDSYDEGITNLPILKIDSPYSVDVLVKNQSNQAAVLAGWIDYNRDGVFSNTSERVTMLVTANSGVQSYTLTWNTPSDVSISDSYYLRIRVSSDPAITSATSGLSWISNPSADGDEKALRDGEVEGYRVFAIPPTPTASSTPTLTATLATLTPTDTPTSEPTATWTETPTDTPTSEPTFTETPTLATLMPT
ncbi:MAG TPA: GEVED domain-containing protein, partial [Anaerolineales bacterium]|nr:GEVED domain-containing protein [Anaerolineales bacterium]